MTVLFQRQPHPRIEARRSIAPPRTTDAIDTFNGRVAILLTRAVGTMWCAYAFGLLALVALPEAIGQGSLLPFIDWASQTFIQLVMLSVIMVGQNILGKAADRRSEMTYRDGEATFHETEQIQAHLEAQDRVLNALLEKIAKLEAAQPTVLPQHPPLSRGPGVS
ncbi:MAG TPA: hypothetical protein VES19_14925 [Candidatus Limnocylindrales bacterium]|nr:hypothetical protein [Candidatus Limnocylindrales bacterium]